MVIVARKNKKGGLKELQEKSQEFNALVNEVFVAADGCSNTQRLVACLQIAYIAVNGLQKELEENWL